MCALPADSLGEEPAGRYPSGLLRFPTESATSTAHGATPSAFERRCIPPGGVAPPSNTPGILGRRALPAGRIVALGATMDLHHGLMNFRIRIRALRDVFAGMKGAASMKGDGG